MTIRSELEALRDLEGLYQPDRIVAWAERHQRSALHAALLWDDHEAAGKYRIWQVRKLIALHIVTPEGVRETVSLSIDRAEGGYRSVADVVGVPEMRDIMVADAVRELRRVYLKYATLAELSGIDRELTLLEIARDAGGRKRRRAA